MSTNPIMLEFVDEFETQRLLIRLPKWGDGVLLNEAICESIDDLRPWISWAQHMYQPWMNQRRMCV